jgi:hypothetical protein
MNEKNLSDLYDEAFKNGTVDLGDRVFCDSCGEEWTGRKETGGLLLGSKAFCPICTPRRREGLKKYHEEHFIKAVCPPDMSFAEWCLFLRGGNNTIKVIDMDKK